MSKQTNEKIIEAKIDATNDTKKTGSVLKKQTLCRLVSKANYVIRVEHNNQALFIQPYGWAKVIKENVVFDKNDARYLTFVKL